LQVGGAAAVLLLLLPAPLADTVGRWEAALLGSALAVAFAALMLGLLAGRTPLNGCLSGHGLFVISKLSYSLYLVHMVFMDSLLAWLSSWPGYRGLPLELQFALYFPPFCAVSAVAALLLHYLVERPFLALKDRI
jgi:peptidoglycan/LPS O-acetylase OafA/YrhL